jgi:co-chaperonin GroES (HSP10)
MTTRNPQGLKISPEYTFTKSEIAEAFPDIDPGFAPFGSRIIVQLRCPKNKSKGGIILVDDSKETEMWNTQIGKVRAIGPLAFHNRTTQEEWPEGKWCEIGDFVRVPKYNQDRWFIEHEEKQVLFMLVNDLDLLAKKLGNPLEVKAYI